MLDRVVDTISVNAPGEWIRAYGMRNPSEGVSIHMLVYLAAVRLGGSRLSSPLVVK